ERADAVAGAQERDVARDHLVEQALELRLDPALCRALGVLGVGRVERASPDEHAGVVVEVDRGQRVALQPHAVQLLGLEPSVPAERLVLTVRGEVLGTRREQQERLHDMRVEAFTGRWRGRLWSAVPTTSRGRPLTGCATPRTGRRAGPPRA